MRVGVSLRRTQLLQRQTLRIYVNPWFGKFRLTKERRAIAGATSTFGARTVSFIVQTTCHFARKVLSCHPAHALLGKTKMSFMVGLGRISVSCRGVDSI